VEEASELFILLYTDTPFGDIDIICLAMQSKTCTGHEKPLLEALKI